VPLSLFFFLSLSLSSFFLSVCSSERKEGRKEGSTEVTAVEKREEEKKGRRGESGCQSR